MSTENALAGAYLVNVTVGDVGSLGAAIVNLSLVVVPSQNKVTGQVHAVQGVENGNFTGEVSGTIYETVFGPDVTQSVNLRGSMYPTNSPHATIEIPIEISLTVNQDWSGKGGFNYLNVHVANVPVQKTA